MAKNKLKQNIINRRFQKLTDYIESYGQSIGKRFYNNSVIPTRSDIRRLQRKAATIHEYEKIFRRYERSVRGFNEKYGQAEEVPIPHNTIDQRTLGFLKEKYEEWKRWRRNWVRRKRRREIPWEDDTAFEAMIQIAKRAIESYRTDVNTYTGQLSANAERIISNAYDFIQRIEGVRSTAHGSQERIDMYRQISLEWEEIEQNELTFIYSSGNLDRMEAWNEILRIMTGRRSDIVSMDFEGPEDGMYF